MNYLGCQCKMETFFAKIIFVVARFVVYFNQNNDNCRDNYSCTKRLFLDERKYLPPAEYY